MGVCMCSTVLLFCVIYYARARVECTRCMDVCMLVYEV
jgi:hypothetical protein